MVLDHNNRVVIVSDHVFTPHMKFQSSDQSKRKVGDFELVFDFSPKIAPRSTRPN